MAAFVKGDVVVVPFPYSDLSQTKRRPAVVVAVLPSGDVMLCQITSQSVSDGDAIAVDNMDFQTGGLNRPSHIRPNKVFTADSRIILYQAGALKPEKLGETIDKIVEVLRR